MGLRVSPANAFQVSERSQTCLGDASKNSNGSVMCRRIAAIKRVLSLEEYL
jgi:hypothetical protein